MKIIWDYYLRAIGTLGAIATILILLYGVYYIIPLHINLHPKGDIRHGEVITIMLTGISIMLTIFALVIAIIAVVGLRSLQSFADKSVRVSLDVGGEARRLIKSEIDSQISSADEDVVKALDENKNQKANKSTK